ncbi:MAG: non-canonical purine NTP pyrophosphatase [Nanoarchaeota archaeon]|nr:non-canonical purine NTP pyrophosphatase [Nanoarchaeota archaeon]MBU1632012.1 non-canonical purine NTP pyrophosphatase [Nanoarchaeota archaeon]
MVLYFITGNSGKFEEAKKYFPELEQLPLDLPEIQNLDPQKVISEKLKEATKIHDGEFFIEDTSLHFGCLNGFPGPLIKWFYESLGQEGFLDLVEKYGDNKVTIKSTIGYIKRNGGKTITTFFEGSISGTFVKQRTSNDFQFGNIFLPDNMDKTFGEMTREEKNAVSMRGKAFQKLRDHLENGSA